MQELGPVGIWSVQLRPGDTSEISDAAAELEELGFPTLWVPGGAPDQAFAAVRTLLEATERAVVATGILSIWLQGAAETAAAHAATTASHPGRFLLGLGVGHAAGVDAEQPGRYRRPFSKMRQYLDDIDAQPAPVPVGERVLAALGPRMLRLSAERSAGAHPYNVPVEHSAVAREQLGAGPVLAPEQAVIFESDASKARKIARGHLQMYLDRLPNYTNNLLRFGFGPEDFTGGGSDRLVDALVAWGDDDVIRDRIRAHHDAGADHVCVQVITADRTALPRAEWRRLADVVRG